jgi:hypothetical protein
MTSIARGSMCSTMALAAALVVGCASGGSGGTPDAGGGRMDSGPRPDAPGLDVGPVDTGPRPDSPGGGDAGRDSGPPDAGTDAAPDPCGGLMCADFQYCAAGVCTDYPNCRGDGTCPTPGDVCRSRRCVPGTLDIDGDGDPAATDCDEMNPMRSSRLPEVCDTIDNDCDGAADDGDPSALCASSPTGGLCMAGGVCACPDGTYDIDRAAPGCECVASPGVTQGASCAGAIDLGDLPDSMGTMSVTGNAIGREVWYRFRAVDTADTTCDQFNVGLHLSADSAAEHEIWVVRGACDTGTTCPAGSYTDYNFAMDFREDRLGMLTGQCPCWTGTPVDNVSPCEDNSTDMWVRVRRRDDAPRSCASYTLTLTNGID